MFDFINNWKNIWHRMPETGNGMPPTEKEPGEKVPYPFPVKKLRLNEDLEIAYCDEGKPDADVLLFLHGMGAGIPSWSKNIPELKKHYRCIALDLPGHGFSTKGDFPYTMAFYSEAVLSFTRQLGLRDVTLVGHSMGGQISIVSALKAPDLITGLVLLSPAGIEPYTSVEKQMLITMSGGIIATGNAFTKNRYNFLVGFGFDQDSAGELSKQLAYFKDDAATFGRTMIRSIEAMLLESVNHELNNIKQPTLIIVAKDDKVSPFQYLRGQKFPEIVAQEAAKLPHGKLIIYESGGHFLQYLRPKTFNKAVLEFLKEKETV